MAEGQELSDDLMGMVAAVESAPLADPGEVESMTPEQAQTAYLESQIEGSEAVQLLAETFTPAEDDDEPETVYSLLRDIRDQQKLARIALERIADAAEKALAG